ALCLHLTHAKLKNIVNYHITADRGGCAMNHRMAHRRHSASDFLAVSRKNHLSVMIIILT
ncbi:MAG: hypothetical protein ACTS6O_12735, partial [Giesbergeria sp.]